MLSPINVCNASSDNPVTNITNQRQASHFLESIHAHNPVLEVTDTFGIHQYKMMYGVEKGKKFKHLVLYFGTVANASPGISIRKILPEVCVRGEALCLEPDYPEDAIHGDYEATTLTVLNSLSNLYDIPVYRILVIAEGQGSVPGLELVSFYPDRFGGLVIWGTSSDRVIASNLKTVPIALFGTNHQLLPLSSMRKNLEEQGVPLMVRTFWSVPGPEQLIDELMEGINWLTVPRSNELPRRIDHACFIPRYGKRDWIHIVEMEKPGQPGRVVAEWDEMSNIHLHPQGVRRLRVHLNCGLGKYGENIWIRLENMTVPIKLSPQYDAMEFHKNPVDNSWDPPSLVRFTEAPPDPTLFQLPSAGLVKGTELKNISRYLRDVFQVDCAWGYRLPFSLPGGDTTLDELFHRIMPSPMVVVTWSYKEIDAFHTWRAQQPGLSLEISGYSPGLAQRAGVSQILMQCLVERNLLSQFLNEQGSDSPPLDIRNETILTVVIDWLRKQYHQP